MYLRKINIYGNELQYIVKTALCFLQKLCYAIFDTVQFDIKLIDWNNVSQLQIDI